MTAPDPHPTQDPAGEHYEKPHLKGWPFVVALAVFLLVLGAIYLVCAGLLGSWSRTPWPPRGAPAGPAATDARWNNQPPQVQIDPTLDLARLRQLEDRRLHACHWNDPARAYATIPIEEAMQLLSDAAAPGRLDTLLPPPQPATPVQLQDQKSREVSPPPVPNP